METNTAKNIALGINASFFFILAGFSLSAGNSDVFYLVIAFLIINTFAILYKGKN